MNEQFLNFVGLRENPFHASPNPRFYYSTHAHDAALVELMFGIEARQGLLLLTGEAGTGKTSILNQIIDWLRQRGRSTAFLFHTRVEPIGLLRLILSDFGVPCAAKSKSDLIRTLHHWLLQRQVANDLPVLILDEAQALPLQTLDEIRLILNVETPRGKLLQIILSGQPELEEKLRSPTLRQLRQRIASLSRLPALTEEETAAYISQRLAVAGCSDTSVFPKEVVQSIYAISRGIPRVVNLVCERALICAYGEQRRVISPEMIQRIAAEFDLCSNSLTATANETQPRRQYVALLPAAEQRDVAEAPPPAVSEREAVPPLARAAVAAATAAPSVGAVPAAAAVPVPVTPAAARTAAAGPVTPVVPSDATPEKPRKYWRKHRSRSVVARIARNSVSTVKQAWEACWGMLNEWVGRARRALFGAVEKKPPVSATKESLTEECWMQIEFDILEKLHPRVAQKPTQKEESTPAATSAMPAPSRRHWRKYRPSSTVVVSARNSMSSVKRMWSAVSEPIVEYVHSVVKSFVRDCRLLFRTSLVPTPAAGVSASIDGNHGTPRSTARRNAIALVHWLRQPMRPPRASSRSSKSRGKY